MRGSDIQTDRMFCYSSPEAFVPPDHPLRPIQVLDMKDEAVARRARELGIRSVPAVVVNGKIADCCAGRGLDEATLREAGIGRTVS
jgi:hypothetical protein